MVPEYFLDAASYWTIAGVDGDHHERAHQPPRAGGVVQVGPEPEVFNWCEGRLWTWADAAGEPERVRMFTRGRVHPDADRGVASRAAADRRDGFSAPSRRASA